MMLRSTCTVLNTLATRLRQQYDVRCSLLFNSNSASPELEHVEAELGRIHKLLAKHRRLCPSCSLNNTFTAVSPQSSAQASRNGVQGNPIN
jgi:hypothetical protein